MERKVRMKIRFSPSTFHNLYQKKKLKNSPISRKYLNNVFPFSWIETGPKYYNNNFPKNCPRGLWMTPKPSYKWSNFRKAQAAIYTYVHMRKKIFKAIHSWITIYFSLFSILYMIWLLKHCIFILKAIRFQVDSLSLDKT